VQKPPKAQAQRQYPDDCIDEIRLEFYAAMAKLFRNYDQSRVYESESNSFTLNFQRYI
jgi:hypothetical protein